MSENEYENENEYEYEHEHRRRGRGRVRLRLESVCRISYFKHIIILNAGWTAGCGTRFVSDKFDEGVGMDGHDDEGGQIAWSAPEIDRRFRTIRRVGIAVLLAGGVSLVIAMMLQPAPPLYVGAYFVIGMLFGLAAVFMRHNQQGFVIGLLSGVLFALSIGFRDAMFPEMGEDMFAGFWAGMSAMVLGIGSVLLPLLRFSLQRKILELRRDAALARRYREQGDSSFVAQMRVSAEKMSKGRMIVSIVMGSVMVGLGLYVWFTEGEIIYLLVTGMMSAPLALLIWSFTLRHRRIEDI